MKKTIMIYAIFLAIILIIPAYIGINAVVNERENRNEEVFIPLDNQHSDPCIPDLNLPTDNVTILNIERAPDGWEKSQFKITLGGINGDFDVNNGEHPGWCVEFGTSFATEPINATLNSSYDPGLPSYLEHENWSYINYILNNKHPDATLVEIQRAIWYFVNFGSYDWDQVWEPHYGPVEPDSLVYTMIDDAEQNGSSFCPDCCDVVAVILDNRAHDDDSQLMIIEVPLRCYEFKGETAWAANGTIPGEIRYTKPGNWATYVEYNGEEKNVTLFAGQHHDVGTVTFSEAVDGNITITITLHNDTEFKPVSENVKIQDYEYAPSGNPAPGLFDHKFTATESPFEIQVPENNFYGVHVEVGHWVEIICED